MDNKQKLQEGLTALGLTLTTAQQLLLLEYVALLKKWNGTYNLTALRDEQTMISHHILDSLTLLPYIEQASTLMDVGSGGGIVAVSAVNARFPAAPGWAAYQASKTALTQWFGSIAPEAAARGVSVGVALLPLVRTRMIEPTAAYRRAPAMTPQAAADVLAGLIVSRRSRWQPWWLGIAVAAAAVFRRPLLWLAAKGGGK